ncbi:MAG TPA: hypothetical protein PKK23_19505 [Nitrospirales bacterium]|nr:hypothetical protein [Nitrospirales bacterium]
MDKVNKRFNRIEFEHSHMYFTNFGIEPIQDHPHSGYLKCKLIHARWGSAILPDQIYLDNDATQWIQPLAFTPPLLAKVDDDDIRVSLYVDISCGNTVKIEFDHAGLVRKGDDGSELFSCKIKGAIHLPEFATGESRLNELGVPEVALYHHTSNATKPLIEESGHLRGSKWNIQGNKELLNVHYVYFTCLDQILTQEDLVQIAMAYDGKVHMIRDGFDPPASLSERDLQCKYSSDILELDVYRESTTNRTASIKVFVNSEDLAGQHLLFHRPPGEPAFYEVCKPFIYRVGLPPDGKLPIELATGTAEAGIAKHFGHIVAGDATNVDGLRAPFDEENTEDIFKIERTPDGHSLASFWFEFCNQDHFSAKKVKSYEFKK